MQSPEVTSIPIFQSYTDIVILVITAIAASAAIITLYKFFYDRPKLSFSVTPIFTTVERDKNIVEKGWSTAKLFNLRIVNTGRAPIENLSLKFRNTTLPKDVFSYFTLDLAQRMLVRPNELEMVLPKPSIEILLPKEECTLPFLLMIEEPLEVSCRFIDDLGRSGKYNLTSGSGNKLTIEMLPLGKGLNYRKPLVWELDLDFNRVNLRLLPN